MMCSTVCEPLYAAESGGTLLTQESEETVQSGEESAGADESADTGNQTENGKETSGNVQESVSSTEMTGNGKEGSAGEAVEAEGSNTEISGTEEEEDNLLMTGALLGAAQLLGNAQNTGNGDGLPAYYTFDNLAADAVDGSIVADASGNGKDAYIRGNGAVGENGVLTLPGGANNSGNAYVELPTGLIDGREELTFSLWLKNQTNESNFAALYYGTNNSTKSRYILLNPSLNKQYFKAVITNEAPGDKYGYSVEVPNGSGFTTATTGEWGLYTIVITQDKITGYYNGEVACQADKSVSIADFGTNLVGYIGKSPYPDAFYAGGVENVEIYGRALTADEIKNKYLTDKPSEDTGNGGLLAKYDFNELKGTAADGTSVKNAVDGGADAVIRDNGATVAGGELYLPGGAWNEGAYVELPQGLIDG